MHKGEARTLARERKEAQAEATAYVVGRHFGLAHPFAAGYLQGWGTLTGDDLGRELGAVVRAAGHIIDRLEGGNLGAEGGDAAA